MERATGERDGGEEGKRAEGMEAGCRRVGEICPPSLDGLPLMELVGSRRYEI